MLLKLDNLTNSADLKNIRQTVIVERLHYLGKVIQGALFVTRIFNS